MKNKLWWIAFSILSITIIVTIVYHFQTNQSRYTNPVFKPVFADPSIIKAKDGYYYAYGTEDVWKKGGKPKLIPIIRSKNLIDWKYIGDAFKKRPGWDKGGSLWAPDIHYFNGKYYLYYAAGGLPDEGIGVAESDKPYGPFKDHGKLFTGTEIGVASSIDPQLFVKKDGTPYLFWGSFHGIYGIQLSADGFSTAGKKFQIADSTYEGSYIIKRKGYYYYFGSRGTCCNGPNSTYYVAVGRSKSLKGPYVDQKGVPLMNYGGTTILKAQKGGKFVGPGHNAIIKDRVGHDWIVYHAIVKKDPWLPNMATKRPLMIDRLRWKDGWPYVKGNSPSETEQTGPQT